MANLTASRVGTLRLGDHTLNELPDFPAAANSKGYEGCMVGLNATGFLVDAGNASGGAAVMVIGVSDTDWDNTGGADGAFTVPVRRGAHKLDNAGTNPVTQAAVYTGTPTAPALKAQDNHTVGLTAGAGVAIPYGRLVRIDSDGIYVEFF